VLRTVDRIHPLPTTPCLLTQLLPFHLLCLTRVIPGLISCNFCVLPGCHLVGGGPDEAQEFPGNSYHGLLTGFPSTD